MASATPTSNPLVPTKAQTVAHRRIELKFARALGVGTGIFLILWGPFSFWRWLGIGPAWSHIEAIFDVIFGALLVFPYARVHAQKAWKRMTILLTAMSVLFVFVLVFDVLYVANLYVENANPAAAPASAEKSLYVYDDDTGPKLPFPVLNCALVFLALMQAPVVFFSRYPEKMD